MGEGILQSQIAIKPSYNLNQSVVFKPIELTDIFIQRPVENSLQKIHQEVAISYSPTQAPVYYIALLLLTIVLFYACTEM